MELYFAPLACSMATRIALYEAGAKACFTEVDTKTKRTANGEDFLTINPLGLVPALRTNDGDVLTENAAILQYVADQYPEAGLAPRNGMARTRLHQWLCFIGTELHKASFVPLFDQNLPEMVKSKLLQAGEQRLSYLNNHLTGREFLLDRFSVADAYLFTVLNWTNSLPFDLTHWPAVLEYASRLRTRPSILKALTEEFDLYNEEQLRYKMR